MIIWDYKDEEKFIVLGDYKTCLFEAYYDDEFRVLHILDAMGDAEGRKSLTNAIGGDLLRELEDIFWLAGEKYRVFLYGTDRMIAEYFPADDDYLFVSPDSPHVFRPFKKDMLKMYSMLK